MVSHRNVQIGDVVRMSSDRQSHSARINPHPKKKNVDSLHTRNEFNLHILRKYQATTQHTGDLCGVYLYRSSRSCVRGLRDAVERRSTASTETRSTAVASTSASTARRSWPTVRPAWCGHGSPATATGLSVPTATFHSCRGDSAANSASKLRPYGDIQIYLLLLLLLLAHQHKAAGRKKLG